VVSHEAKETKMGALAHVVTLVATVCDFVGAVGVIGAFVGRVTRWWSYAEGLLIVLLFSAFVVAQLPTTIHVVFDVATTSPEFAWVQAVMYSLAFVLLIGVIVVMWRQLDAPSTGHNGHGNHQSP
jgi:hypothetical protein